MSIAALDTVLLVVLVLIALALIGVILIQQGKGADMGAAFGSGAANTLFGSAGASSFLVKLTTCLAIAFFLTTFALAYIAGGRASQLQTEGIPDTLVQAEVEQTEATSSSEEVTPSDEEATPATDVPTIDP